MKASIFAGIAVSLALSGCVGMGAAMDQAAGLGKLEARTSGFDGATTLTVTPTFLAPLPGSVREIKLGAAWISSMPETAALMTEYSSGTYSSTVYVTFISLDLNIDGEIVSLKPEGRTQLQSSGYNSVANTIFTTSTGIFPVDLKLVDRLLSAKSAKLRFVTSKGIQESDFAVESYFGGTTAKPRIAEWRAGLPAAQ